MKKEKGWLPSMKKEKEWIGSISESSSINRRSAGTRKRLAPFKFGSFSRGCGKNHGSGKGHPSTSEIFPSLKKFASLPRKRKRGKNRSLPPRHRASTFSLLFLPFPPHFLPKLPSGGLTNPLRKNKILPSRPSPPLAESSICTHTEIL